MTISTKLRRAPLRIVTGAFILNSGLTKARGDEATAKAMHGMASGAYPVLGKLPPTLFLRALSAGEITLGATLLTPVVPAGLAGAALTGFSGSLLGIYWRTPGMHAPGDPRPTQQGTAIAKDTWMFGIGSALVVDAALSRRRRRRRAKRDRTG